MIDRDKIQTPCVLLSDEAVRQLELMYRHDHTLKDKVFRIQISGKGCAGFSYECGWTDKMEDDIVCTADIKIPVHMSPFCAFYTQQCEVDYQFDDVQGQEGFLLLNHQQKNYTGKFWRNDPLKTPPQIEDSNA